MTITCTEASVTTLMIVVACFGALFVVAMYLTFRGGRDR